MHDKAVVASILSRATSIVVIIGDALQLCSNGENKALWESLLSMCSARPSPVLRHSSTRSARVCSVTRSMLLISHRSAFIWALLMCLIST